MMRWKVWLLALIMLATAAPGCSKQSFLLKEEFENFKTMGLPIDPCVENDPSLGLTSLVKGMAAPQTVIDTDREARYLTLVEAIASTLEQGTTGILQVSAAG